MLRVRLQYRKLKSYLMKEKETSRQNWSTRRAIPTWPELGHYRIFDSKGGKSMEEKKENQVFICGEATTISEVRHL